KHLSRPLTALYARITSLVPVDIGRINNPLGPQRLCDKFSDACLQLNIDIKARLVVFKLFDKHVVGRLDKLYSQANEQLIADNILPDFRFAQRPSERTKKIVDKANSVTESLLQGAATSSAHQAGDFSQEIYQLLQQLNHCEISNPASTSPHPLAGALNLLSVSAKPAIGHELLLQLLTSLQQDPARITSYSEALQNGEMNGEQSVLMPRQLTQGLSQSLSSIADGGDHSIGQAVA
ncbi:MAG: DUF1631 family protein, partial [Pseudomonadales bacterium]